MAADGPDGAGGTDGGGGAVGAGPWVDAWLSPARFDRYVRVAGGDRALGLALYEWNARVSAAFLHDLAHLEIGLRNAYDRVLSAGVGPRPSPAPAGSDWTDPDGTLFAPLRRSCRRGGTAVDINERVRADLRRAREAAGVGAPHGKVVAELMFGFWRYLSSAGHEKTLWVPHLHKAFPRGTDRRRDVDEPIVALNRLRNRAAHHEHLLSEDLAARHDQLLRLTKLLSADLGQYLAEVATVPHLLKQRPGTH